MARALRVYRRHRGSATLLARPLRPWDEDPMEAQIEDRRSFGMTTGTVVLVAGTLGAAYMVSQVLRNSIGVIAPDLAAELTLLAAEIGLLSSAFFVAFAAAQVPLGVCLDRCGPEACMLACSGIVIAGALSFAAATTPLGLVGARSAGLGLARPDVRRAQRRRFSSAPR
jgi:MFS family permease